MITLDDAMLQRKRVRDLMRQVSLSVEVSAKVTNHPLQPGISLTPLIATN